VSVKTFEREFTGPLRTGEALFAKQFILFRSLLNVPFLQRNCYVEF